MITGEQLSRIADKHCESWGYQTKSQFIAMCRELIALAQQEPAQRCNCCGYLVTDSEHKGCLRAADQEPAQAVPVGYVHNGISRLLKAQGGTIIREKYDEFFDTPLYAHPAPLDSDTRKLVLELCDYAKVHYWHDDGMVDMAARIIERLEAGE